MGRDSQRARLSQSPWRPWHAPLRLRKEPLGRRAVNLRGSTFAATGHNECHSSLQLSAPILVGHAPRLDECGDGRCSHAPANQRSANFITERWGPKLSLHHPQLQRTSLPGLTACIYRLWPEVWCDDMSSPLLYPQSALSCDGYAIICMQHG